MTLEECMRSHTERQLSAWIYWLDEQWDRPSRSDWYLMQITCEIRRFLAAMAGSKIQIQPKDFKLTFVQEPTQPSAGPESPSSTGCTIPPKETDAEREERIRRQTDWSKSIWLGSLHGIKAKVDMKDERFRKFNRDDF